ncbi:MAG: hypothetical protein M3Z22_08620 [Verrucomicrobiota bacterium]|nr:hypothetical protein [Verrucomicrobiota bacterium]
MLIADADVLYFPGDRAASGSRSEPAAMLLAALEESGKPLAIAWDSIAADQQSLLDELQTTPSGQRDELIARLEIAGTGRAREHCRAVLRDAAVGVRELALGCPAAMLAQFTPAKAAPVREEAGSARARTFAQQFAAEQIVRYFRGAPGENKLLGFLDRADLEEERGVPTYVAQKLPLRQLVFGSGARSRRGERLLTGLRGRGGIFEVVDRAPITAGN